MCRCHDVISCCNPCYTACTSHPPCCKCPCPIPPESSCCGMLIANGNGEDVWGIAVLTINIPFGPTIQSTCGTVAHGTDTSDFIITETGEYEIDYQLAARNDAVGSGLPIELYADLQSKIQGTLDSILFTEQNQLKHKRIIVQLNEGDVLYLQGRQPIVGEMIFNQQTIMISKICGPQNSPGCN